MFSWLRPQPPLGAREKAWVETRLHQLANHLGIDSLLKAKVVLPSAEYFPEAADGVPDRSVLWQRIAKYLPREYAGVVVTDPAEAEGLPPGPGAACDPDTASCDPGTCARDLQADIATFVCAASRTVLPRITGVAEGQPELEAWAELASLYLGFGVLAANSTTVRRALSARTWGYALALFAWVRDEAKPAWADYLRPDPLASFRGGLRYLRRGGDSLFGLATARTRYEAQSINELTNRLTRGPACGQIAAIWELARRGPAAAGAVPLLVECLHARHGELRAEAATALGRLGPVAAGATEDLIEAMRDIEPQVRAAAAGALGSMDQDVERVVPELAELLSDDQRSVVREVAGSLRQLGSAAAPALPSLLEAFRGALVACDDSQAAHLAASVRVIASDPAACISAFLAEHDADLRHAALDILQQQGLHPESADVLPRES